VSIDISIRNAVKAYGDSIVIPDLSLDIKSGELFTLLGPSGCGKTTLLRMIAGFNSIQAGDIMFNERRINDLEPAKRNIGMVFQNYAIFPHMSVRKNVEFGLRQQKLSSDEVHKRATEFMELVQIGHLADRMPDKLSGGQQQRVALARALCTHPDVLLMDEPLSNLDAKLRVDMRTAIKDIQRRVGTTTVYVTHDQEEAMAISDRIAVMKDGYIQHLGTPEELYHRPANVFVANFIGRSNFLDGKLTWNGSTAVVEVKGAKVEVPGVLGGKVDRDVTIAVRPEHFTVEAGDKAGIGGTIAATMFLGLHVHYVVKLADGTDVEVVEESDFHKMYQVGDKVTLTIKPGKVNVYTTDGEVNLLRHDPDTYVAHAAGEVEEG